MSTSMGNVRNQCISCRALDIFIWLTATLYVVTGVFSPRTSEAKPSNDPVQAAAKEKVIIDTDIGIDIDDAFAVALALRSPELGVLAFSTVSGDTSARAKIIDRMLGEAGQTNIPVVVGPPTTSSNQSLPPGLIGLQKRYGEHGHYQSDAHPPAVEFILKQIREFPGQITLVIIGPLSNVGALIDRDAGTFQKLKRVVMMGGWVRPVVNEMGQTSQPAPEYNIEIDVRSAQKLFTSGVPIYMMPIDSTGHLALDEVRRQLVFSTGEPVTDALAILYHLWGGTTPVLYDAMAVAYTFDPQLCPVEPMHIVVDEQGVTRDVGGIPNAQVCLHSDANTFLDYYVRRVGDSRSRYTR